MTLLHRFAAVLRWLLRRNTAEQDLHDELDAFVEMAAHDSIRDGVRPAEARRWRCFISAASSRRRNACASSARPSRATPHDPLSLLLATGVLLTVALVAAFVPADRASRIDPLAALH